MSMMTIEWHEDCARCWADTIAREQAKIDKMLERLRRDQTELAEYLAQIERAKVEKRAGFDRDKFGKRRKREG